MSSTFDAAITVLHTCITHNVSLNKLTYHILAKLVLRLGGTITTNLSEISPNLSIILSKLRAILQGDGYDALLASVTEQQSEIHLRTCTTTTHNNNIVKPMYTSCLGPSTSEDERESVIVHDIYRLIDRLDPLTCSLVSSLTEYDFATLIHQIRKRKWGQQIKVVLTYLKLLIEVGIPERNILPQKTLAVTAVILEV